MSVAASISVRNDGPQNTPAASASGAVVDITSDGPSDAAATICTAPYRHVTRPSAMSSARGIVREGLMTSPDNAIAVSAPENANIRISVARPRASALGIVGAGTSCQPMARPTTMNNTSGASLATVMASTNRAPCRTPRRFSSARPPESPPARRTVRRVCRPTPRNWRHRQKTPSRRSPPRACRSATP